MPCSSGGRDSCRMTVLDLEQNPVVHPRNWKSLSSSAGTDLKLDLQQWWWGQQLVGVKGLWLMVDE